MAHKQQPYDPARSGPQTPFPDRRARDLNRGVIRHIVECEVEDPYEPGAMISTLRSVRDDPLGDHFARGHLDEAQFLAGREFQRQVAAAERGPRAIQLSELVDGSPSCETLTDGQLRASKWLARWYGELGKDGSRILHEFLVEARSTRQIAAARGVVGLNWERYFFRRLRECLNTLSEIFGFSNGVRP